MILLDSVSADLAIVEFTAFITLGLITDFEWDECSHPGAISSWQYLHCEESYIENSSSMFEILEASAD